MLHPTAIIAESAVIGEGTTVGPYSLIGPNVVIGKNNSIAQFVTIEGYTTIGDYNKFFQYSSIGSQPQDLKWRGENSKLIIGDNNIVREYVSINTGVGDDGITKIGNKNLFMANSHIAHDCTVEDGCWLANSVALAGYVTLKNNVILGGISAVHQYVSIHDYAFIAGGSIVCKDAPPYSMLQGDRARIVGVNTVGLQRGGFSKDQISDIRNMYRKLYYSDGIFTEKFNKLRLEFGNKFPSFFACFDNSKRGVVGSRQMTNN